MTQDQVKDYLLGNDCEIYEQRIKSDGIYYYIKKKVTKKMAVIYPLIKHSNYTKGAICHICETLEVTPPPYAADYCKIVKEAKEKAKILVVSRFEIINI